MRILLCQSTLKFLCPQAQRRLNRNSAIGESSVRPFNSHHMIIFFACHKIIALRREHFPTCSAMKMLSDDQGCILHTQHKSLSPIEMMSLLDSLGYPRAVVLNTEHLTCGLIRISFCNNMPKQAIAEQLPRARTAWPHRDVEHWEERPLLPNAATADASGQHRVLTGFDNQDLAELRDASDSFCRLTSQALNSPSSSKMQSAFHATINNMIDGWYTLMALRKRPCDV